MKEQLLLWVSYYWKRLIVGAIAFCAALLLLFSQVIPSEESNIKKVEELFTAWKLHPEDAGRYRQLRLALKRSSLRADVAQLLLALDQAAGSASELALPMLKEFSAVSSLHAEYSNISLLIGDKHYQEALEKTVSLKEKLTPDSLLFACSLVRVAFLQQQLENRAGELAAWKDLEHFCKDNPSLADQALKGLGGRSSAHSYIENRRRELK